MLDINYLYDVLKSKINGYIKFIGSSKEIVTRCPYCGDSIKHQNKGHFYIGESSSGLFLYQCKRAECCATGVFSKRVLEDLDVFDLDLFAELNEHNLKHSEFKNMNYKPNKIIKDNFNFNIIEKVENLEEKLSYLKRRIFNFDINDLNKYRIILSIKNYIRINKISVPINKNQLDLLEKNAIGFRSLNKSCIIFRFINDSSGYRYYKLKITEDDNIYGIENNINLNEVDNLKINIAEGIFDIINIERRLKSNCNNEIFLAANSADYISKIEYIARYSGFLNLDISIYRDSDAPIKKILSQFKNSIFKNNIRIYSNSLAKDYTDTDIFIIKDF